MIHAKAMAIVIAYDMYLECAEGNVEGHADCIVPPTKPGPVSFHRFREKLAKQMLAYAPRQTKYLGDDKMRDNTARPKAKRYRSLTPQQQRMQAADGALTTASGVTVDVIATNAVDGSRMCGFITPVIQHYAATQNMPNKKKLNCHFCGKPTYQFCNICKKPLHKLPQKDVGDGKIPCFLHYHNTAAFGLARDDWHVTGKKLKDWSYPSIEEHVENETQVRRMIDELTARTLNNNMPQLGNRLDGNNNVTPI